MHAILAHAYHLAERLLPLRPEATALAVAAGGRLAGLATTARRAAILAAFATLAGWLWLSPALADWPPAPVGRLPGLAVILLAATLAGWRMRGWPGLVCCAVAAWWLRGAPLHGAGLLGCVPVLLGLVAALGLAPSFGQLAVGASWPAGRAAGRAPDADLVGGAAALAMAAGLAWEGAATHWSVAALVPGFAALGLMGCAAGEAVVPALVLVAASAIVASDRGRLPGVDMACILPLGAVKLRQVLTTRPRRGDASLPEV